MDDRFGQLFENPTRSWKTKNDDSDMRCYLGMKGRITLQELVDHFAEKYPHVDLMRLRINYATVEWDEPPSPEDIERRRKQREAHAERTEKWERETLARLTAKYT